MVVHYFQVFLQLFYVHIWKDGGIPRLPGRRPRPAASLRSLRAALENASRFYKQPITRVEIEEIRGVNCEMMLKKLVARGLIEAKDRLDAIGKPLLYRVTDEFLDAFQLEDLKELPELPQTKNNSEELFEGE